MNNKKHMIMRSIGAKRKGFVIGICIGAAIILIFCTLTTVVGYQYVKSKTPAESPLFSIRTRSATKQQQNIITTQYLGIKKSMYLQFPIRDNRTGLLIRMVEYIKNMDDRTFNEFIALISNYIQKTRINKDIHYKQIKQELRQVRDNAENYYFYEIDNIKNFTWNSEPTVCLFPGCYIIVALIIIFGLIIICSTIIWDTVVNGETACFRTCISHCSPILDINEVYYHLSQMKYNGGNE